MPKRQFDKHSFMVYGDIRELFSLCVAYVLILISIPCAIIELSIMH